MACSWVVQGVLGLFWGVLSFSNEVFFFRQISFCKVKGCRVKGNVSFSVRVMAGFKLNILLAIFQFW